MQREHIPPLKMLLYALLLLGIFVLETAHGAPVRVLQYRVDVLAFAVAAIALLDGPVPGAAMGFVAGILYDLAFTTAEGLYPMVFLLFGIAVGLLGERFLRRIYPSALLLGTSMMALLGLWRLLVACVTQTVGEPLLFLQSICGQTLVAAAFSWIPYLLVRAISRRFAPKDPT